jgi:uroporphyrinogen decarboxylase
MNKIDRVNAVLAGRLPDYPPFSCWRHFGPDQVAGPAAVEAHRHHAERYDLDFLKIMNDNRYPRLIGRQGVLETVGDLERLPIYRGDEDRFGRQLEVIDHLARHFSGELYLCATVFNAWTTLRLLTAPHCHNFGPPVLHADPQPADLIMAQWLCAAPQAVEQALAVIAESLAHFAAQCITAGANGVFLSVRDDWVERTAGAGGYDRLVAPGDRMILQGAADGAFNMVHVCGKTSNFQRFADYSTQVISWADRQAGPSIADAAAMCRRALCAGIDQVGVLAHGSIADNQAQVANALHQAGERPILVAPGCAYHPDDVPKANIQAIREACRVNQNIHDSLH